MKKFFYNAVNNILYILFLCLAFAVRILPGFISRRLGILLGWLIFYLLKDRRELAIQNIQQASGLPEGREAVKMAKQCFINLGIMGIEFLRFGWMPHARRMTMFNVYGEENLKKAFAGGKGVMALSFHMGNWELLGAFLALNGYPLHPIVQRQSSKGFDKLINRYREKMGMKVIYKGLSMRHTLRAFANNEMVSFIMDQYDADGVTVDFFGRPAQTPRGAAVIQEICRPPVIPIYIIRRGFEKHDIYFEPPLELIRDPNLSKEERILKNTEILTKKAEEIIKKAPDQWLWMHKRWRN